MGFDDRCRAVDSQSPESHAVEHVIRGTDRLFTRPRDGITYRRAISSTHHPFSVSARCSSSKHSTSNGWPYQFAAAGIPTVLPFAVTESIPNPLSSSDERTSSSSDSSSRHGCSSTYTTSGLSASSTDFSSRNTAASYPSTSSRTTWIESGQSRRRPARP